MSHITIPLQTSYHDFKQLREKIIAIQSDEEYFSLANQSCLFHLDEVLKLYDTKSHWPDKSEIVINIYHLDVLIENLKYVILGFRKFGMKKEARGLEEDVGVVFYDVEEDEESSEEESSEEESSDEESSDEEKEIATKPTEKPDTITEENKKSNMSEKSESKTPQNSTKSKQKQTSSLDLSFTSSSSKELDFSESESEKLSDIDDARFATSIKNESSELSLDNLSLNEYFDRSFVDSDGLPF